MSKQITVRLPDNLMEFVDQQVADGAASSRADLVARALRHEERRVLAIRDAEILRREGEDPEIRDFMTWVSGHQRTRWKDLD